MSTARHLHISATVFTHESRAMKEIRSTLRHGLADHVEVVARWRDGLKEVEELPGVTIRRLRLYTRTLPKSAPFQAVKLVEFIVRAALRARFASVTTICAHSLAGLIVGAAAKAMFRKPLVYDAHELETEANGNTGRRKRFAQALERRLIRAADSVMVVSGKIEEWYRDAYDPRCLVTVRNIPERPAAPVTRSPRLRRELGLGDDACLYLYLGGLQDGRGIAPMLQAFGAIGGNRHLAVIGEGPMAEEVDRAAARHPNIHRLPYVPMGDVLEYTSGADVGLVLIEPTTLSYYYCLPNKLFESLLAGIPVIVSDFPEMGPLVTGTGVGWAIPPEAEALRELVERLTPADIAAKAEAACAAREHLCWENEEPNLLAAFRKAQAG